MERRPLSSLTVFHKGGRSGSVLEITKKTVEEWVDDDYGSKDKVSSKIKFKKVDGNVSYYTDAEDGIQKKLTVYQNTEAEIEIDEDSEFPFTQRERELRGALLYTEQRHELIKICPYKVSFNVQTAGGIIDMAKVFYDKSGFLRLVSTQPFAGSWKLSRTKALISNVSIDILGYGQHLTTIIGNINGKDVKPKTFTADNDNKVIAGYLVESNLMSHELETITLKITPNHPFVKNTMVLTLPAFISFNQQALLSPEKVTNQEIPFTRSTLHFE